jgi:hypothetical protein
VEANNSLTSVFVASKQCPFNFIPSLLLPSALGLVRFYRIAPGIVPANQSLYKLEKQSG